MKLLSIILVCLVLASCGNRVIYVLMQEAQFDKCISSPKDETALDCRNVDTMTYDEYMKTREELMEEREDVYEDKSDVGG